MVSYGKQFFCYPHLGSTQDHPNHILNTNHLAIKAPKDYIGLVARDAKNQLPQSFQQSWDITLFLKVKKVCCSLFIS